MTMSVVGDLRQAWRSILRTPIVAAVVVGSLGIGIGVNTTVFSWIQGVVLRPLPGVPDATRFHLVETRSEAGSHPGSSWLEYRDFRSRIPSLPDLIAYRMAPFTVGAAEHSERTYGLLVSGNYFAALRLTPALGRFIAPEEASANGGDPVVVLSYEYWQTRYDRAPNV